MIVLYLLSIVIAWMVAPAKPAALTEPDGE